MTQPSFETHDVFNQSPPFADVNLFTADRPLVDAVTAYGAAGTEPELAAFGALWGSAEMAEQGRLANENTPKLRSFDAKGFRRDVVEFHPAYHQMMARAVEAGLHNSTWTSEGRPRGAPSEVVRAAKFYIAAQVESGHLCPITMTRASVAALAAQPDLLAKSMPVIATRHYDAAFAPWWQKRGMTLGMGMTEKQGGTDVRANMPEHDGMTMADPLEGQDVENMTQAEIDAAWAEWERQNPDAYDGIADACVGPVGVQSVPDPRRVGWLLAANPYAVLADASPWDPTGASMQFTPETGPLNMMSAALRLTQQDPAETTECLDGQLRRIDTTSVPDREGTWPVWPLGLAMQAALTGGLLWWGHRRLDTPAGRLPAGTRVA